jgi:hypothetical protein
MALPEIPKGRFTWVRLPSHGWAERPLQLKLIEFVTVFEDEHAWVRRSSMVIEERFADSSVNVRVPTGPTAPEQRKDNFLQRAGLPTIKISTVRDRDSRAFEVTLPFPLGNDSPMAESLFAAARESLRMQEVQAR